MLSDGIHDVTAMLTSQLNHFVNDGSLQKYTVIRLKDYFANQVSGRKCVSAAPRARNLATSRTAMLAPLPPAARHPPPARSALTSMTCDTQLLVIWR